MGTGVPGEGSGRAGAPAWARERSTSEVRRRRPEASPWPVEPRRPAESRRAWRSRRGEGSGGGPLGRSGRDMAGRDAPPDVTTGAVRPGSSAGAGVVFGGGGGGGGGGGSGSGGSSTRGGVSGSRRSKGPKERRKVQGTTTTTTTTPRQQQVEVGLEPSQRASERERQTDRQTDRERERDSCFVARPTTDGKWWGVAVLPLSPVSTRQCRPSASRDMARCNSMAMYRPQATVLISSRE